MPRKSKSSTSPETLKNFEENVKKLTTTKKSTTKSTKKSSVKRTKKSEDIVVTKSPDKKLFPYENFIFRLEDKKENKTCWFECFEYAQKYIQRYNYTKKDYKLIEKK